MTGVASTFPRPLVLLANDDGHGAAGLGALRAALTPHADVIVCAPASNQSASSHSLTLHRVLRLRLHDAGVFSVDGTPADCVYVALNAIGRVLPRVPDLCVSGLNHGLNLGVDVFYSGTVAAAREAALRGVPSIAFSADSAADRPAAAAVAARISMDLLAAIRDRGAATSALMNVNFPRGSEWMVRATRLGRRTYGNEVVFRKDPRGGEYLWIGGSSAVHHDAPGSDTEAYDEGVVGITPLGLDLFEASGLELARLIAGG